MNDSIFIIPLLTGIIFVDTRCVNIDVTVIQIAPISKFSGFDDLSFGRWFKFFYNEEKL